ncbi:MAG: amino acid permease [Mycoplasmataceae bacterium]|nr:amino acid permease [Mycoplasmataceae bacterium]
MKEKTYKKLGFFSALSICIGSVVGIGIFFKNGSISNAVSGDGTSWILTWLISGIIAFLIAIHFGRIASIDNNGLPGLSGWAQSIATKKQNWFRHLVTINYSFFYNSLLIIVISFFTVEIFANLLKIINPSIIMPMYAIVILTIALMFFNITINKISVKTSGIFSSVTTIVKFIPLTVCAVAGIIFANTHNSGGTNGFVDGDGLSFIDSFQGIMKSLPAALFAFDAFVGVGSMSRKIKGGEKVVSKVIVFSMLFIVVSFLFISISAILHYDPNTSSSIEQILSDIFSSDVGKFLTPVIMFFLLASAAGTTNSITGSAISEFENISRDEKVFFSKELNEKFNYKITSTIYISISLTIWSLASFIPVLITDSDSFIDGLSNIAVLFFFIVYGILIFLYWKNIYMKNKITSKSRVPYTVLVFISVIGAWSSMILSFFSTMMAAIQFPNKASSWGFLISGDGISNLVVFIIYLIFIVIFILLPLINWMLFKNKKEYNIFQSIDNKIIPLSVYSNSSNK